MNVLALPISPIAEDLGADEFIGIRVQPNKIALVSLVSDWGAGRPAVDRYKEDVLLLVIVEIKFGFAKDGHLESSFPFVGWIKKPTEVA